MWLVVRLCYLTFSRKWNFGLFFPLWSICWSALGKCCSSSERKFEGASLLPLESKHWHWSFCLNTVKLNRSPKCFWFFILRGTVWSETVTVNRENIQPCSKVHIFGSSELSPDSCLGIYKLVTSESISWAFLESAPASPGQNKGRDCRYVIHSLRCH